MNSFLTCRTLLSATMAAAFMTVNLSAQNVGIPARHTFAIGGSDFLLDGKPLQIRCGEIHFARVRWLDGYRKICSRRCRLRRGR